MRLYEMVKKTQGNGLFASDATHSYWLLQAKENAHLVDDKNRCTEYDVLYAIIHDTNEMTTYELLYVMYERLSTEELKQVFKKDEFLEKIYFAGLGNYILCSKLQSQIQDVKDDADSAVASGNTAMAMTLLK